MPITQEFAYLKPETVNEAVAQLVKHGRRACVLAGGTDLVGWLRDNLVRPEVVIDVKRVGGLYELDFREKALQIGALVTWNDLLDFPEVKRHCPVLWEAARTVGSSGLRNRASVAGNICSAVPCCDGGPALLVYEAEIQVTGPAGQRNVPATEWFVGPRKTALQEGELVTGVAVPQLKLKHGGAYLKLGRYRGEDLAQASVAVLALSGNRYRVAFGAVAPFPFRARKVEEILTGRKLTPAGIAAAQKAALQEIKPITDLRASKEYRAKMVRVMLERGIRAAVARLGARKPAYGENLL